MVFHFLTSVCFREKSAISYTTVSFNVMTIVFALDYYHTFLRAHNFIC